MKRWLAVLCVCVLTAAACSKKGGQTDKAVGVGAAGPFTGDMAVFGADQLNAMKLAVDEWNARGGVLGKRIVLVEGDDQRDPKQAVAVANRLVNEGVAGVVGHLNSNCSIPASEVYHRGNIPVISHGTTNPSLTEQGFGNVFRVCGRDDQQGKVSAQFAAKVLKAKRVVILHDKTTYGQGLADVFRKELGSQAETVLYEGVNVGEKDYSPVVTKVQALNPDLIFFGGIYVEGGLLIKQFRAVGGTAPLIGGDAIMGEEYVKIGGSAAEGTYATFSPDSSRSPTAGAFNEKYRKKYGEPGVYSIYAYDATNILLQGIREAGTVNGKEVSAAIRRLSYDGAVGHVQFDAKGDVKDSPYVIWKVSGGKWQQVR